MLIKYMLLLASLFSLARAFYHACGVSQTMRLASRRVHQLCSGSTKWKEKGSCTKRFNLNIYLSDADDKIDDSLDLPAFVQDANKLFVGSVKNLLFLVYGDRNFARFAALETIARVPYFSYTSVLHLYETLGWFRKKEYIQIHFAESWNELHHLLIMEELGGSEEFFDRFVAQHIAFFYFWIVVALYIAAPAVAYDLNKHVESHAFDTYDKFLTKHAEELKNQPAPQVAVEYYQKGDLYMFDAFQYNEMLRKTQGSVSKFGESASSNAALVVTDVIENGPEESKDTRVNRPPGSSSKELTSPRRPEVNNLYDVFVNIREDEAEHAETMQILQRDVSLRSRGRD